MRIDAGGGAVRGPAQAPKAAPAKGTASGKSVAPAPKPPRTAATQAAKSVTRGVQSATVTRAKAGFQAKVAGGATRKGAAVPASAKTTRAVTIDADAKTGAKTVKTSRASTSTSSSAAGTQRRTSTRDTSRTTDATGRTSYSVSETSTAAGSRDGVTRLTKKKTEETRKDLGPITARGSKATEITAERANGTSRKTETTTTRGTHVATAKDKKASLQSGSASASTTVTRGTEKKRATDIVRQGARKVDDLEKDALGKELWSASTSSTAWGKKLDDGVQALNEKTNKTWGAIAKPDDKNPDANLLARGKAGELRHQGSLSSGMLVDTPEASATLGTKGVAVKAKAGVNVALIRGDYALNYASPSATVAGIKLRNETDLKVSGMVGAEAKGELGVTIAPTKGVLVASAGGEAFAGAKAKADLTTGISRRVVVDGKEKSVSLAKATGTAEGWAGAGISGTAKVGFEKGKLSFKLEGGAALGLGGKLGVSGEVDVVEGAKAVGEGAWNATPDEVKDVVKGGAKLAGKAADKAGDAARDVGGKLSGAADEAKKAAGKLKFW